MDLDLDSYARLMAELCAAGPARAEVLAKHGLDEARWAIFDSDWQDRLSQALDEDEDGDGVPALIAAYTSAYEAARRSLAPPISLDQFAHVTRLIQASGDLQAALAKVGVSFSDYVRGSEHWSPKLATDPDVERRFKAALRTG